MLNFKIHWNRYRCVMRFMPFAVVSGIAVALAGLVVVPNSANAQQWYISGSAGGAFLTDSELSDPTGTLVALGTEVSFDFGFNGAIAFGYKFNGPFRVELEAQYASNDIDSFRIAGVDLAGGGSIDASALMANVFLEFDWQKSWRPYLGGGIGVAFIEADDATITFPGLGTLTLGDDDDTVFAYQAGAGIGFDLNPNWLLSLDYRYFATSDPDFSGIGVEYSRHDIRATLRWSF